MPAQDRVRHKRESQDNQWPTQQTWRCSETVISANTSKYMLKASRWGFIQSFSGRLKFGFGSSMDSVRISNMLMYAGFNVFIFNLTTYCMARLILLLLSDASLALKYSPTADSVQRTSTLQNCSLCYCILTVTKLRFITFQADHLSLPITLN